MPGYLGIDKIIVDNDKVWKFLKKFREKVTDQCVLTIDKCCTVDLRIYVAILKTVWSFM